MDALFAKFQEASKGRNFTVYKKSDLNQVKPYWHFYNNRRIMPLLLVADPGYVFDDFYEEILKYYAVPPYNHTCKLKKSVHFQRIIHARAFNLCHIAVSRNATYGTHGYDNHEMSMHPFFMAHGPLFYSDGRDVVPFDNLDLFPLFAFVSGFEQPANNGSQDAIKRILLKERHQIHLGAQGVGWIVGTFAFYGFLSHLS